MRKNILMMAGVLAAAGVATAQPPAPLDLQIPLSGSAVLATTTATGGEFDGVAVTPDAATIYLFDSVSQMDGILKYASSTVTAFATEANISGGTGSAGDLDASATNLYAMIFDSGDARNRLWNIPAAGFGSATEMIDSTGSLTVNLGQIEIDDDNSRLVVAYNDAFGAATENIVTVPLAAVNATPTTLVTETALEAVLATVTGYVDDTSDDVNIFDLTVQNDGDIIFSHGFSSNRQINGSLLRVTDTGTVSVFRTADQIITAAGADPNLVDIGSVNVEALSADEILIHVQFSSATATLDPFIAVVSADGSTQTMLATQTQLAGDTDVTTALVPAAQFLFRMDGKGGDVAANDDYYFYRQATATTQPATENAVLALVGVRAFLNGASVNDWSAFE